MEVADWRNCYLYMRVSSPKKRGVAEEVLHTQRHDATTVRVKKQASARLLVNEAALSAGCK